MAAKRDRTKAFASTAASGNPNPSAESKEDKSREEGEISSGDEDAVLIGSHGPSVSTTSTEPSRITLGYSLSKTIKIGNNSTVGNVPLQKQSYSRNFRMKQTPFKGTNNRSLCWQKKSTDDDLVISFSDDDSGSDSGKLKPKTEPTIQKKDIATRAGTHIFPMISAQEKTKVARQEAGHNISQISKSGFASQAYISSIPRNAGTNTVGTSKDPHIIKKNTAAIKTSTNQVNENACHANSAENRLESLRHEIAQRENELRVQKKSLATSAERNSYSPTKLSGQCMDKAVELPPSGQPMKRQKLEPQHYNIQSLKLTSTTSLSKNNEQHMQKSSYLEEDGCLVRTNSKGDCQGNETTKNHTVLSKVQHAGEDNGTWLPTKDFVSSVSDGLLSKQQNSSVVAGKCVHSRKDVVLPDSSKLLNQSQCLMKMASGLESADLLTCTDQGDIPLEGTIQSLMDLEELQDRELEEAQEHRRRCELEERRALKAYRNAQRALIKASERCGILYRNRELFSGRLHGLIMENFWQNHRETMLEPLKYVPKDSHDFLSMLSEKIPGEQMLERLSKKSNIQCSDTLPQQRNGHESTSDQCCEPDASTSDPKDDEENFTSDRIESRTTSHGNFENHVDEIVDVACEENELLEAALRSELVARMGNRKSSEVTNVSNIKCPIDKATGTEQERPAALLEQQFLGEEENDMTACEGTSMPVRTINQISAQLHSHSPGNVTSGNGISKVIETEDNSSSVKDVPDVTQDCTGAFNPRCSLKTQMDCNTFDPKIDPFWPFCIYELRGKCYDEECPWQHAKSYSWRKSKTEGQISCGLFQHLMPVPIYHVGSNLIKDDSYLSCSMLARSIWQYWQRGFCASFPLPFSVLRILPPDAPFLPIGDGSIADYDRNRQLFNFRGQGGNMKKPTQRLPDSEQSLELALDFSCGKVYKADRKKALSQISRAIEADPHSAVLWIVYLHIYYQKEREIGNDDMFLHAVQNCGSSYELWLMYINSRVNFDDRLNAYNGALSALCSMKVTCNTEIKDRSAVVLDVFLQMVDFLCMSGRVEKAISRIHRFIPGKNSEYSGEKYLTDFLSCLLISDKCIFWVCCTYLLIYQKLPERILEQLELEKELSFKIEWPSAEIAPDKIDQAIELFRHAFDQVALEIDSNSSKEESSSVRAIHFLAISHINCVAALQGIHSAAGLLVNYMGLYPNCAEIFLLSVQFGENYRGDVVLGGFEEVISNWPREVQGIQYLWNQYAEHVLANKGIDFAEKLMTEWFRLFGEVTNPQYRSAGSGEDSLVESENDYPTNAGDDFFWFLNLFLYKSLQKNSSEAQLAIDRALHMAGQKYYKHCLREHAALYFLKEKESPNPDSVCAVLNLLSGYLRDRRTLPVKEPLSRRFYQNIKKLRVKQLMDATLGPVSPDCSLINTVLGACHGPSLLPQKLNEPKDLVDFVESIMGVAPSNYKLALSVYRFTARNFTGEGLMFWAGSILVNSILQVVPVAPESVWLQAANLLGNLGVSEISRRFYQQATSVYPFSRKLWQSYLSLSKTAGNGDSIMEAARERGVELST
ncbi:uncharacterized protein LOC109719330 isoform X3 [Ananas comosus]|uniref:Uncharacterized protein LOC109719330 isoform X3 n=1 Tax=Ananas comosus TaxID=4615 RepID=A0A6P5FYR2_ANACO|nr:uncharacterized protein LOC109719330 isoform X3 [Ananas comosus]